MPKREVDVKAFRRKIRALFRTHKRDFLWRRTQDPYHILISEVMLQQTQTARVERVYPVFLKLFPNVRVLAKAKVSDVLRAWQGMGYNRRVLSLKKLAEQIITLHYGRVPADAELLDALPGIGINTAGAIMAFAFNKPVSFIETNIRRVFLDYFFPKEKNVSDEKLIELVEATLDMKHPREWYWALMDYGAMLAKKVENPNRRSKHYNPQPRFAGSDRELRGKILKFVLYNKSIAKDKLFNVLSATPERIEKILTQLIKEGFLAKHGESIVTV